jgi:hypothetical protein
MVDLDEVNRRWGPARWVWSARAKYLFHEDGTERRDLAPVDEVTAEDYSDESGWWTCHRDHAEDKLSVIYRSAGKDDDFPLVGPRDLRYVFLATKNARPLKHDPFAGKFANHHGCPYVVVSQFDPPITIDRLRREFGDTWPALRAGFVQAAMPMPPEVWERLIEIDRENRVSGVTTRSAPTFSPAEREAREARVQDWLATNLTVLRAIGLDLTLRDQSWLCGWDHQGRIDLLLEERTRPGHLVAVELKVDEVRREAVAQVLGYVGWLRQQPWVRDARGLILGNGAHRQVPFVLDVLDERLVQRVDWSDLPLPPEIRRELRLV